MQGTSEDDLLAWATDAGVFEHEFATGLTRFGHRCQSHLGLEPDQPPGPESLRARLHSDDGLVQCVDFYFRPAPATESTLEHRIVSADGSVRWVQARARTEFAPDEARRPVRLRGVIRDVTDRRSAEESLSQNEQQLCVALRAARAGVWSWDPRTNEIEWSPEQYALFDLSPADRGITIGAWEAALHPDDRDRMRQFVHDLRAHPGAECRAEFRVMTGRGPRWLLAIGQLARDSRGGTTPRYVGMNIDITERKRTEELLRRNADIFHGLIQNSPFGIFVIDADFKLLQLSRGATQVFEGITPLLGRDFGEVLRTVWPQPFATEAIEHFRATLVTGFPYQSRRTIERRANLDATQSYDWRLERIVLPDDRWGVVCYFYDLSERQRWEEQLRTSEAALIASQRALLEADRRKDEFLATLSHELRNPLAPIRTAARLLDSPALAPHQLKWVQGVIQRQVKHMALLLDDLLDVARITQGKLELKVERVVLSEIIDSAVEAAQPLIDSRHHRLDIRVPAEPVILYADPLRLSQVIANLLTNAAKYTDPAGSIVLSGSVAGGWLSLTVKDDGIGIPAGSLNTIFEMFSQVPGGSARCDGGLGIGLALVRGLTELHGGKAEARSEGPGRGSEFSLSLPLDAVADAERPAGGPAPSPAMAPAARNRRRILVADDAHDAADALAMLLTVAGHEVQVAHDGRAAVVLAHAFRPDIALLDIGMPELNGYEVAAELRREPWGKRVWLIALSGWGQESDRQRAREAGFDRHFTKPFDPEALDALFSSPPPGQRGAGESRMGAAPA